MISHYLSSIDGISMYPIIALIIFIPFFVAVTYKVFTMDKSHARKMAQMPLDSSSDDLETK